MTDFLPRCKCSVLQHAPLFFNDAIKWLSDSIANLTLRIISNVRRCRVGPTAGGINDRNYRYEPTACYSLSKTILDAGSKENYNKMWIYMLKDDLVVEIKDFEIRGYEIFAGSSLRHDILLIFEPSSFLVSVIIATCVWNWKSSKTWLRPIFTTSLKFQIPNGACLSIFASIRINWN